MLICISPSKTLADDPAPGPVAQTVPDFLPQSEAIIRKLNRLSLKKIKSSMAISDKLAALNQQRYRDFSTPFTPENATPCIRLFKGDVYDGLDADSLDVDSLDYAQNHLRILSGLYGVLRPLDLIQPYRLEMGTNLSVGRKRNLYQLWQDHIAAHIAAHLEAIDSDIVLNLASQEYFKAVDVTRLPARVITPAFKEERNGDLVMISFFAKKARGMMARYAIENRIHDGAGITGFVTDGYRFSSAHSTADNPVFIRSS